MSLSEQFHESWSLAPVSQLWSGYRVHGIQFAVAWVYRFHESREIIGFRLDEDIDVIPVITISRNGDPITFCHADRCQPDGGMFNVP